MIGGKVEHFVLLELIIFSSVELGHLDLTLIKIRNLVSCPESLQETLALLTG